MTTKKPKPIQEVGNKPNPDDLGMEHFIQYEDDVNFKHAEADTVKTPIEVNYGQGKISKKYDNANNPWKQGK